MLHYQPLQANGELDVTAAYHVLHLEACEPGLKAEGGGSELNIIFYSVTLNCT